VRVLPSLSTKNIQKTPTPQLLVITAEFSSLENESSRVDNSNDSFSILQPEKNIENMQITMHKI